jgi:hypothetical protein
MPDQGRQIVERPFLDIPAPRGNLPVEHYNRQPARLNDPGEWPHNLMRPGPLPFSDLTDRIAPPLQPHLGDQWFLRDPWRPRHL